MSISPSFPPYYFRNKRVCPELNELPAERSGKQQKTEPPETSPNTATLFPKECERLSLDQQMALLPFLSKNERSRIFPFFSAKMIQDHFDKWPKELQKEVLSEIPEATFREWYRKITIEELELAAPLFNHILIETALSERSFDKINSLFLLLPKRIPNEIENEIKNTPSLTHTQIAFIFLRAPQLVYKVLNRSNQLNETQRELALHLATDQQKCRLLSYATADQIQKFWLQEMPLNTLIKIVTKLNETQLVALFTVLPNQQCDQLMNSLIFFDRDFVIWEEEFEQIHPNVLALCMKNKDLFASVLPYTDKMTTLQVKAATAALPVKKVFLLYERASAAQKRFITSTFRRLKREESRLYFEMKNVQFMEKTDEFEALCESIHSFFLSLKQQEEPYPMLLQLRVLTVKLFEWTKQSLHILNLLRILTPSDPQVKEHGPILTQRIRRLKKKGNAYLQNEMNEFNPESTAFRLAAEHRRKICAMHEESALLNVPESRSEDLTKLYLDAQKALTSLAISGEDLDKYDLSWEDVIEAGIRTRQDLFYNGIRDIRSLKEFIQSERKVSPTGLIQKIYHTTGLSRLFS